MVHGIVLALGLWIRKILVYVSTQNLLFYRIKKLLEEMNSLDPDQTVSDEFIDYKEEPAAFSLVSK